MIQTYHTTYTEKEELAPDIYRFRFALKPGEKLTFTAGQYMILFVPPAAGQTQTARRLYSILTTPVDAEHFDIVLKILPHGAASQYLIHAPIGEEVLFQGPAGLFIRKEAHTSIIFLATGTGIVPIKSMIDYYFQLGNIQALSMHLLWGLPRATDVYFLEEWKKLCAAHPNFKVEICLSREQSLDAISQEQRRFFRTGRITDALENIFTQSGTTISDTYFYLCGGREIVESLRQLLNQKGVAKDHVHFEKF